MLKYFFLWFLMVFIAIFNGGLREKIVRKFFSELKSHQLSCLIGIILFAIYIWLVTDKWMIESVFQAWMIGFMWLLMTVLFEFVFGHYVMKNSWVKLLADYKIQEGRLWILVLIWVTVAPYLFYQLRSKIN